MKKRTYILALALIVGVILLFAGCTAATGAVVDPIDEVEPVVVAEAELLPLVLEEPVEEVCEVEAAAAQAEFWTWHWDAKTAFWLAYYEANRPEPVEVADEVVVAVTDETVTDGTAGQGASNTLGAGTTTNVPGTTAPPANAQTPSQPSTPPTNNNSGGGVREVDVSDAPYRGTHDGGAVHGSGGSGCFWGCVGPCPH